jgi:hypothetical protein
LIYVAGGSDQGRMVHRNSVEIINTIDWTISVPQDNASNVMYASSVPVYPMSGPGGYDTTGVAVQGDAVYFAGGRNTSNNSYNNTAISIIDYFTCGNYVRLVSYFIIPFEDFILSIYFYAYI